MYFYLVFFPERWEVICKNAASALIMLSHSHAEKAGPRAAWEEVSALSQEPSSLSEAVGTAPGGTCVEWWGGQSSWHPPRRGCGSLSLRPTREVTVRRRLPGHGPPCPSRPPSQSLVQLGTFGGASRWDRHRLQVRTRGLPWWSSSRDPELAVRRWGLIPGRETGCHTRPRGSRVSKQQERCRGPRQDPAQPEGDKRGVSAPPSGPGFPSSEQSHCLDV